MALTPMMQQYFKIKDEHPDCILFYRLGDFYEMFFEDALTASKVLEIALTARDCGGGEKAPMCGVPFHSANSYINKLISSGYKVAICEQMSDPKESKGLVERGIVRIITPGTLIGDELESDNRNNYVLCAYRHNNGTYYISLCDVSTGEFLYNDFSGKNALSAMISEIMGYAPMELVLKSDGAFNENMGLGIPKSFVDDEDSKVYADLCIKQFGDVKDMDKGSIIACGMLLKYLFDTQKNDLNHITCVKKIITNQYMKIDSNAKKHLELFESLSGEKKGTLLHLLDKTDTSMGARLLRGWLNHPLMDMEQISSRQNAIGRIVENPLLCARLHELLDGIYDIERIISKLSYKTINPRDCVALKKSLEALPDLKQVVGGIPCNFMADVANKLDTMDDVCELLDSAIVPEPPITLKDGNVINPNFSPEIKELYDMSKNSNDVLLKLEAAEREATDIKGLKLGYNRIFGYYFEVTKSYYDKVPYRYIRKQTLANCERFITEELKDIENKITGANERRIKLETAIYEEVRDALTQQISRFQTVADCIASVDCINSLGDVATRQSYICPSITKDGTLKIERGRHPIVEGSIRSGFVANDTYLNSEDESFAIITGPNMAGKSTYMRQIALIVIMAHMGSYVPAKSASISVTSKIFARIGALDNLNQGKSTFMVEMSELADIVSEADKDSLIILDEIGRGTSTIDGVCIAIATVHYITERIGAKTLFATHYHQLSTLEEKIPGVVNYKVAVKEEGDKVAFLHAIKRGGTDKSFGIYVAKLAGLPSDFIAMANHIMESQAEDDFNPNYDSSAVQESVNSLQLQEYEQLKDAIAKADINNMTPIGAMELLFSLKEQIKE